MYISLGMLAVLFVVFAIILDKPALLIGTAVILFIKLSLIKVLLITVVGLCLWNTGKNVSLRTLRFWDSKRKQKLNASPVIIEAQKVTHKTNKMPESWYSDEIEKLVGSVKK